MVASKGGDSGNQSKVTARSIPGKVVAIPFPIAPRHVLSGPRAKVLDFRPRKESHNAEDSNDVKKTLEQITALSISDQKLWLIRKILNLYDHGEREELHRLCEILCEEPPNGA